MTYIKREPVTVQRLTCSHPQVDRIWEYGGLSHLESDNTMHRVVCIMLKNGERKEFEDGGEGKAIEEAEQFLSTLSTE